MKKEDWMIIASIILLIASFSVTTWLMYAGYYTRMMGNIRIVMVFVSLLPFFAGMSMKRKKQ